MPAVFWLWPILGRLLKNCSKLDKFLFQYEERCGQDAMMMRAAVFSQTRYFQNNDETGIEVQQVVKRFEKLNPLKNKQTVVKR